MFTQMWEPHQTSAFLNAFFVKLFMLFTKSTAGLVIYLHIVVLTIKAGVTFLLFSSSIGTKIMQQCGKTACFCPFSYADGQYWRYYRAE